MMAHSFNLRRPTKARTIGFLALLLAAAASKAGAALTKVRTRVAPRGNDDSRPPHATSTLIISNSRVGSSHAGRVKASDSLSEKRKRHPGLRSSETTGSTLAARLARKRDDVTTR